MLWPVADRDTVVDVGSSCRFGECFVLDNVAVATAAGSGTIYNGSSGFVNSKGATKRIM